MNLREPARRRRGEQLEEAILAAAWDQLLEGGYANFTIDAVASKAGTSRSVLYRRWPDRDALITATIDFGFRSARPEPPDTGSLRDDAIALMVSANEARAPLVPLMSVLMGSYFSATGVTFADLRRQLLGDPEARGLMDLILDRAVARGEVDPARITRRARTVAFDLIRHDLMMTLKPVPRAEIVAIVDQIFLPLMGVAVPDHTDEEPCEAGR